MPVGLILGVVAVVALIWLRHWRPNLSGHDWAQAMRAFTAVFGSFATTGLAIGGRFGLAAVALIATLAAIRSLLGAWQGPRLWGDKSTTASTTQFLDMRLDHENGEIDGIVKAGRYAGVVLSLMELSQLMELREEIRLADRDSLDLIDAYLDFARPDWRDGSSDVDDEASDLPMSEDKALDILELEPGASAEDIRLAHRRLMAKVHPDRGGSSHLATQVNLAKDFLLNLHST